MSATAVGPRRTVDISAEMFRFMLERLDAGEDILIDFHHPEDTYTPAAQIRMIGKTGFVETRIQVPEELGLRGLVEAVWPLHIFGSAFLVISNDTDAVEVSRADGGGTVPEYFLLEGLTWETAVENVEVKFSIADGDIPTQLQTLTRFLSGQFSGNVSILWGKEKASGVPSLAGGGAVKRNSKPRRRSGSRRRSGRSRSARARGRK